MAKKGNIFALLLLALASVLITITAPSSPARAEILESCEVGIKACRPFGKLPKKYQKCMRLICADRERILAEKKKKIKQCTIGYQKCDPLRDEPLYYWTCVHDTCNNIVPNSNQDCAVGHSKCTMGLRQYWWCMSNQCNSTYNLYKTCDVGVKTCAPQLNDYWSCVTDVCLGSPYRYRDPTYYKKNRRVTNPVYRFLNDNSVDAYPPDYTAPPLKGVPDRFRYAPKGVNPYDWLSAIPAPTRLLKGTASDHYECGNKRTSINCVDSDISSCQCADGSVLSLRRSLEQKKADNKANSNKPAPRVVNSTNNKAVNQTINKAINTPNQPLIKRK
jgi:hypothetical protein